MITLTDMAVKKVKEMSDGDVALKDKAVRVMAEAGGCSGNRYGFGFDDKRDGDAEFEISGLRVVVDPDSGKLLAGTIIDYRSGPDGEGFSLSNPNAKKGNCGSGSCGCAEEAGEKKHGCGGGSCGCN